MASLKGEENFKLKIVAKLSEDIVIMQTKLVCSLATISAHKHKQF